MQTIEKKCPFCGSADYEAREIDYLYQLKGQYLLVPNTPVEVCHHCGMVYYDAAVLKKIESCFFAILNRRETADSYLEIPTKACFA
jgi:YgiT-type zinc finger domain-containing protein